MTIHILANPAVPTNTLYPVDPFTIAAWKYIKHLSGKYDMILYGLPGSKADCKVVEIDSKGNNNLFNQIVSKQIGLRKSPGDIIACFYGWDNRDATLMHTDCLVIEPSIGYVASAVFAKYRVFVSYAQMHMVYGEKQLLMQPCWHDDMIPNSFTVSDFTYKEQKQDYFLYFGRVIPEKGIDLCINITNALGKKLIIAGPIYDNQYKNADFPPHVEYVGVANQKMRNELMSNAACLLGPTLYVEPFGNMVIEANLCGTPVITTDWGGFTETVIHGKTGYRCRSYDEMVYAGDLVTKLNPQDCRENGLKYSDETIHEMHHKYLQRILSYPPL